MRQTKWRTAHNQKILNEIKSLLKKSRLLIVAKKKDEAQANTALLIKAVDRASRKNVITKNKAARIKSRIILQLNKL